jgi:hypothetical protein
MNGRHYPMILALGTTQTLAWASSYYLPAILADLIPHDLGLDPCRFLRRVRHPAVLLKPKSEQ